MTELPKPPERLWKYRKWKDREMEYAIAMIVRGEINFSTKLQLNDPFEFRWHDEYPDDPEELDQFVRQTCSKTYGPFEPIEHRRAHYQSLLAQVKFYAARGGGRSPTITEIIHGVFSASEINSDILMWSHYADHHEGVCIGIRPDVIRRRFRKVNYLEHVPGSSIWNYLGNDREVFVQLSLAKSLRWESEKEWRTIGPKGPHAFPGCVDRVVIGACASAATRKSVREAVEAAPQDIQILEAHLSDREYALVIKAESAGETDLQPPVNRPHHSPRSHRKKSRSRSRRGH